MYMLLLYGCLHGSSKVIYMQLEQNFEEGFFFSGGEVTNDQIPIEV